MPSKHQISSVRRSLKLILLYSLSSILWLNHTPLSPWQSGVGDAVTAETRDASQLVQQIQESKQAIAYYRQTKNWLQVGQMLTQQAQAYKNLGQPIAAIALLNTVLQIARAHNNSVLEALALTSRGEAYQQKGDYKQAISDLQDSLKISNTIKNSVFRASALKNLGNTYVSLAQVNYFRANSAVELGDDDDADILRKQGFNYDYQALKYFQKSLILTRKNKNKLEEIRLLINSIIPAKRTKQSNLVKAKLQEALVLLEQLPDSQDKVYAVIELAKFVQVLDDDVTFSLFKCPEPILETEYITSQQLLQQAVSIAQRLADNRALSFALGYLAHLSKCRHNYEQALKLTREAESVAENVNAKDSLYLWKWQVARILKAQNKPLKAITAYKAAISTLKLLRSRHVIFDSKQEPEQDYFEIIYRELIELKLSLVEAASKNNNNSKLNDILTNVEDLKLVELQNYFGKSSLTPVQKKRVEANTDKTTAVFYSIILENCIAIIVSLPNSEKHLKWIYIDRKSLRQQINEFRRGLERRSSIIYNPQEAQSLYDSIVRPFAKDLDSLHVKTLVFINDGILRTVPMAALHDGEEFLVQRYAIATTPSLTLTNTKKVNHENLKVLAVGLTKNAVVDGRTYEALTNVKQEINQVVAQIPNTKQLLDENFTYAHLHPELSQIAYSIIHIATHGTFGTVPEDSFLVTGNNAKLTLTDLDNMIGSVAHSSKLVDLLLLTACETAIGDNRVGLGLAGVVVNPSVKSVLASLWSINDAATVTLVKKFYTEWYQNKVSKAEALRRAQLTLISSGQYAHPYYWAPFILVGNWL
ncbi:CHAT domain-containing protein [Tolypothrix campylonemoides VB511288]|nr:CHAT domain-containing protein [Tolypothrix campylonemoides VB511288]